MYACANFSFSFLSLKFYQCFEEGVSAGPAIQYRLWQKMFSHSLHNSLLDTRVVYLSQAVQLTIAVLKVVLTSTATAIEAICSNLFHCNYSDIYIYLYNDVSVVMQGTRSSKASALILRTKLISAIRVCRLRQELKARYTQGLISFLNGRIIIA